MKLHIAKLSPEELNLIQSYRTMTEDGQACLRMLASVAHEVEEICTQSTNVVKFSDRRSATG